MAACTKRYMGSCFRPLNIYNNQSYCELCGWVTGNDDIAEAFDYNGVSKVGQVVTYGAPRREDKSYAIATRVCLVHRQREQVWTTQ